MTPRDSSASNPLVKAVQSAWGWSGISPKRILEQNAFGNLLIEDHKGVVWRLCPEELYCEPTAASLRELAASLEDEEARRDWNMHALTPVARDQLGELEEGQCYCLKIPGVLGGAYEKENLGTITLEALVRFAGDLGRQVSELPDGARCELRIID